MKTKQILIIIQIIFFVFITLTCCESHLPGTTDKTPRDLDKSINSAEEGIPYATERVLEWGKEAVLKSITAKFEGTDQIRNRKGTILYSYYTLSKDKKANYPATADVIIDMNKNSIVQFIAAYDQRIKVKNISDYEKLQIKKLSTDKWNINISEAFDIVLKEFGESITSKYDNPKVILRCSEIFWDFAVYAYPDAKAEELLVVINPETGEIISSEDKTWSNNTKK